MPTPTVTKKSDLAYRAGTSDKVYHIWVENVGANHFVKFKYGRRGGTLNEGTKVGPTHAQAALDVYEEVVAEKLGKGYKPMKAMSPPTDPARAAKLSAAIRKAREATGFMDPELGRPIGKVEEVVVDERGDVTAKITIGDIAGISGADVTTGPETKTAKGTSRKVTAKWTLGSTTSCQLLNPIDEGELEGYINDPKWCFQEKHDGRRMLLLHSAEGEIAAWNRKGQNITPPAEYCSALQSAFAGYHFIIDGEACGDKFYAFDILTLESIDCRKLPYHERLTNLGMLIRSGKHQDTIRQVVTAETKGEKKKLVEMLRKRNGEGLTIKDKDCPYTAARPNSYGPALKLKFIASASCAVTMINAKRSIGIGLYRDEGARKGCDLTAVGNVTIPANHKIPEVGEVVEVQYLYAYKGGSLYQPVYKGPRDDVSVDTFDRLKYKPGEMPASVLLGKTEDLSAEIMEAVGGVPVEGSDDDDLAVVDEDTVVAEKEPWELPPDIDIIDTPFEVSDEPEKFPDAAEKPGPSLRDIDEMMQVIKRLEKAKDEVEPDPRARPASERKIDDYLRAKREYDRAKAAERQPEPPATRVDWTYDSDNAD